MGGTPLPSSLLSSLFSLSLSPLSLSLLMPSSPLIRRYIKTDMATAEQLFQEMKRRGIEPNAVTYGTLINGFAKQNDVGRALEMLEELEKKLGKANEV
jgi:pentatricopeptide repeat protein